MAVAKKEAGDRWQLTGTADASSLPVREKRGEYLMEKTYEKPTLTKRQRLATITALMPISGPVQF